jgi:anti-sigma-K factor RskA
MNVKEYISSGIIESYVLGLASEAERNEFEANCAQYPEIVEARNAFELLLEEQMLADAPAAPSLLQQQIQEKIKFSSSEVDASESEEEKTPVRYIGAWRWVAAACFILLAGAVYWALSVNKKYQDLQAKNKELENQVQQSTSQLDTLKQESEILQHSGMKMAALKGTTNAPQALATVYWDTAASKNVYLMINNLPQPTSDKQYQLWALLDGKPIDLGVFDMDIRQKHLLVKMQNVQKAQAFAITLEPKGGSKSPTLNSMYVMGSL